MTLLTLALTLTLNTLLPCGVRQMTTGAKGVLTTAVLGSVVSGEARVDMSNSI